MKPYDMFSNAQLSLSKLLPVKSGKQVYRSGTPSLNSAIHAVVKAALVVFITGLFLTHCDAQDTTHGPIGVHRPPPPPPPHYVGDLSVNVANTGTPVLLTRPYRIKNYIRLIVKNNNGNVRINFFLKILVDDGATTFYALNGTKFTNPQSNMLILGLNVNETRVITGYFFSAYTLPRPKFEKIPVFEAQIMINPTIQDSNMANNVSSVLVPFLNSKVPDPPK